MGTLGDLKTRVADELNRTDLTSQIALAITSAIDFYGADTQWFKEERATDTTVASQEFYALPSDFVSLNTLRCTINSTNDYPLIERTNQYFESVYQPSAVYSGYPQDYTIYDEQLRMGPIPNGAYTLTLHYVAELAALSGDGDSNKYTAKIAEQMIRFRAKADLLVNIIKDYQQAAAMKAQEMEAKEQLNKKSTLYNSLTTVPKYL